MGQVEQNVYQGSNGGETYCPLEKDARIVVTSTPRFAFIIDRSSAKMTSPQVENDLGDNHGRQVARSYLQNRIEGCGFYCTSISRCLALYPSKIG